MINILFLHSGAELYGADVILYNVVTNLDRNKFAPYVILPNDGPLVNKLRTKGVYCNVIDYPILRRKYLNPRGVFSYIRNYFKACKNIKNIMNEENISIDIIHSNTSAVLEGIALKVMLKCKLVFHVHEMIEHPRFLKTMFSYIFKMFGDRTICVSNAVKKHLNTVVNNDKILVIHNGVDTNIFKNCYSIKAKNDLKKEIGVPKNKLIIGMIGRINAIKGQDDLINAFLKVYEKNKEIHLLLVGGVFAGQEWRYDELKQKVSLLNKQYGNIITLCDFREDNFLVHSICDIYVLPSVQYDSFPTVVLESLATGKAVVAYNCGGVNEMIQDKYNGELVEWHNIESLADSIYKLSVSPALREEYGKYAVLSIKNNFSIMSQIIKTEELYLEVINQ